MEKAYIFLGYKNYVGCTVGRGGHSVLISRSTYRLPPAPPSSPFLSSIPTSLLPNPAAFQTPTPALFLFPPRTETTTSASRPHRNCSTCTRLLPPLCTTFANLRSAHPPCLCSFALAFPSLPLKSSSTQLLTSSSTRWITATALGTIPSLSSSTIPIDLPPRWTGLPLTPTTQILTSSFAASPHKPHGPNPLSTKSAAPTARSSATTECACAPREARSHATR
jgi:hypothetical protein